MCVIKDYFAPCHCVVAPQHDNAVTLSLTVNRLRKPWFFDSEVVPRRLPYAPEKLPNSRLLGCVEKASPWDFCAPLSDERRNYTKRHNEERKKQVPRVTSKDWKNDDAKSIRIQRAQPAILRNRLRSGIAFPDVS